ncbi:MAG TPA: hypothetical protein EYQ25_08870 [Planctomycetes bacterium]|nr:hypothetical protein [Planctomycetota bacterium]HIL37061.1 hypothetical protein [Planctomycetota bacterium]
MLPVTIGTRTMRISSYPLVSLALLVACAAPVPTPQPWPLRPDPVAAIGGQRRADLVHLSLDLELDHEAREVRGVASSWFRALRGGTTELLLHGVGLEIQEVLDATGQALEFEVREPEIRITLARPLAKGEEEVLHVRYRARPERGLFFRDRSRFSEGFSPSLFTQGQKHNHRHWLPLWDEPNDRATLEVRVRVGLSMEVVSNGQLVEVERHSAESRSFHWRLDQRVPTYLLAVIAGRFDRFRAPHGSVELEFIVAKGAGEQRARETFGETAAMLNFFEAKLGTPFPYPRYSQAALADFVTGGMENATLTLVGESLLGTREENQDLEGRPRRIIAHELAHQWFGDQVTCWGWSHLWLNEAFASWLELAWVGEVEGENARRLRMEQYRERFLARSERVSLPMALDWHTQGCSPNRAHHVYTKGPWVIEMMSRLVGAEEFDAALALYLKRHRDSLVTADDLVQAVFDATGRNLMPQVQQWVWSGGLPELTMHHEVLGQELVLSLEQAQETTHLVPLFDCPLTVDLITSTGRARHEVRFLERSHSWRLPFDGELLNVLVDPEGALLCSLRQTKSAAAWLHQAADFEQALGVWRALPALRQIAGSSPAARALMLRILREHSEPLLRQRAARQVTWISEASRAALVRAVCEDQLAPVRSQAARSLLDHIQSRPFTARDPLSQKLRTQMESETSVRTRETLLELLDGVAPNPR